MRRTLTVVKNDRSDLQAWDVQKNIVRHVLSEATREIG